MKLFGILGWVFRVLTGTAFAVLIASVLIQVFSRLALPSSPVWTEELARFALLYLAAAGCGLAIRSGELVHVDLLVAALPERARLLLELVVQLAVIGFLLALIPPAWQFTRIGAFQTSSALGWPMSPVHFIVVLAPLSLIVFGAERCVRIVESLRGRPAC